MRRLNRAMAQSTRIPRQHSARSGHFSDVLRAVLGRKGVTTCASGRLPPGSDHPSSQGLEGALAAA
jgi:hypothetical protein